MAKLSIYASKVANLAADILQFIKRNPKVTGLVIIGGVLFFCPHLVTAPVLKMLGFTSTGPVVGQRIFPTQTYRDALTTATGSAAAQWQALIGAVSSGSTFATAQSAGMAGQGLTIVNGVVQGIGLVDLMLLLRQALLGTEEKKLKKSKL